MDDDSILLKITEDMLGRNGVECTTCQNAKEAILALDRLDYDLVLTDIQMPVTDGFGLLRLLRNSDIGNSRIHRMKRIVFYYAAFLLDLRKKGDARLEQEK